MVFQNYIVPVPGREAVSNVIEEIHGIRHNCGKAAMRSDKPAGMKLNSATVSLLPKAYG
jgi:hypothetical protein